MAKIQSHDTQGYQEMFLLHYMPLFIVSDIC